MKITRAFAIAMTIAATAAFAADPYPAGSIAFFNAQGCPAGWTLYQSLVGYTVLPVAPDNSLLNTRVGTQLASGQDPVHTHTFNASASLSGVSYALLSGCCNDNLTGSGKKTAKGTTSPSSAHLPYVQLLACQKIDAPASGMKPPSKVLVFSASKSGCSGGWSYLDRVIGRFIVGVPTGGASQATFGPSLGLAAVPTHSHAISQKVDFKSYGVGGASGGSASGYGKKGEYTATGEADSTYLYFPYVGLVPCEAQ